MHHRLVGAVEVPHSLLTAKAERLEVSLVRWDYGPAEEGGSEGPWVEVGTGEHPERHFSAEQARALAAALLAAADLLDLARSGPETVRIVCDLSDRLLQAVAPIIRAMSD